MAVEQKLKLEDSRVLGAIERLRRALPLGGSMKRAFTSIGRIVESDTKARFREQKSPEGVPWIPSQRVLEEGGQTLRLTGRLQRSINYKAEEQSVEIGTNLLYARIHQLGGIAGRKNFSGEGPPNRSRIPARPYLGASDSAKIQVIDSLNEHLSNAWR